MIRKIVFSSMWLLLVGYGVAFGIYGINASAKEAFQQDLDLIINMSILEWDGINPILIAVFFIMGIFPLLYGAFILFDSKKQPVSPVPFFATSFGLGAFALLPYFVLRQRDTNWDNRKSLLLKALDSRLVAIISSTSILAFIIWGVVNGNWSNFVEQWHTSQFVHVMTIDFCTLSILLPFTILEDDMERRGVEHQKLFWIIALIPLFGSLIYWCVRPQLPQDANSVEQGQELALKSNE